VHDFLDKTLRDDTRDVAYSFQPAPAEAVRARGDQRRRRQAAAVTLAVCAVLLGGGGAVYAAIGPSRAQPPVTRPGGAGPLPGYLVTAVAGKAQVRASATGRVVAAIRPPAGVFALEGVTATPGDRVFYLAGAQHADAGVKIEFFRLTLGAGGRPDALRRLAGAPYRAPLPVSSNALTTIPLAVSPDGRQLAFASGSQFTDSPGATLPSGSQGIVVQNVATGARRVWRSSPASHTEVSSVSWASGGRLGFVAAVGDAAVSDGAVVQRAGGGLNVLMVLNTAAPGTGLTGDSQLVTDGPVSASKSTAGVAGPSGVALSRDGRTAYTRLSTAAGASRIVAISVRTGRVTRVLVGGPAAADPAIRRGGLGAAGPVPMSVAGTSLLFPLSLPHPPDRTSGPNYVIGHLAAVSLATGQVTTLPLPLYYGTQSPAAPVGAAW
jgi:hypothetical protein